MRAPEKKPLVHHERPDNMHVAVHRAEPKKNIEPIKALSEFHDWTELNWTDAAATGALRLPAEHLVSKIYNTFYARLISNMEFRWSYQTIELIQQLDADELGVICRPFGVNNL